MNIELIDNPEQRQKFIKDNINVQLNKEKLLKDAEWNVEFYEREIIRDFERLELAKLTLIQLKLSNEK
jgi:hypothetical protein|tara:strand:+ start:734 stop:937 length:204 start_codon:yes stop_codon:yes gene_type:complete